LSRQLRLDVAQLTDVGRKRPHNEDNMAYVIPKDPQVMAKKGALFIVADGMGGHAAGEVASEIAVDTVSKVYYQDDNEDITTSLLHAIKRANTSIHQRAAENMLRSGMGTTCVAAVLRGSTAYIANVGDSRAYLVRKGVVRQVSQDHSWVEEQVRAGLLTRDQARSHAQRNVITRSLGTQPDVEIDVFSEGLEEGDSLVLCTDGLSGLIGDDELRSIVDQYVPQESVYHLVERANENGGSDNITAIVMRVQELGWEPPGARRPVIVGGRGTNEDTAVLEKLPGTALGLPSRAGDGHFASPLRVSSGPLVTSESITAPQPAIAVPKQARNRLFYPALVVFVLLVVALITGGAYYILRLNRASADVDNQIVQATLLVSQARAEVGTNPGDALQKLSQAQKLIVIAQQQGSLSDSQRTKLTGLLQGNFTATAKSAIGNYNQQSVITLLPCTTNTTNTVIDAGNANVQVLNLVSIRTGKGKASYALGSDHAVYEFNDQQHSLVKKIALPGNARADLIAADDTRLLVLASPANQGDTPTSYTLNVLLANAAGAITKTNTSTVDAALLKDGHAPHMLTAQGENIYLVLTQANAPSSAIMLGYTLNKDDFGKGNPRKAQLSLSTDLVSVAAFPNDQLFLLFSDGKVQSLRFANGNQSAVSVVVQQPIPTPLPVNPQDYTPRLNIPLPAAEPAPFLSVPRATLLAASSVDNVQHLFIADDMYNRVLDLIVSTKPDSNAPTPAPTATNAGTGGGVGTPLKMELHQQYVSADLLATIKSLSTDPTGIGIQMLTQSDQQNGQNTAGLTLVSLDTRQQSACQAQP
jgi:serine/threonine protein phosphatase PrpC